MKDSLLNYDYIKNYITTNEGVEEVPYRWTHGATWMHLGDGLIIYTLINFFKLLIIWVNSSTVRCEGVPPPK